MIKVGGMTVKGRKFVILGLSDINLIRLRQKKLVVVHGVEVGLPELETLIICWGESQEALHEELKHLINETTTVRDRRGEKKN